MKKKMNYPEQVNVLCGGGTRVTLIAIAYFRGQKGRYADTARDFIADGITRFMGGLSHRERGEFGAILESVRATDALRNQA